MTVLKVDINTDCFNRPFPTCFKPHYESEASCIVLIMQISFHSNAKKNEFLYEKLYTFFLCHLCST